MPNTWDDLGLSGSCDVIGHVTILSPSTHFLQVLRCNKVCISSHYRDNRPQIYWGPELSGSRDVSMGHFLFLVHWNQVRISSRFRDHGLQIYWGHDHDLSGSRDVISHMTIRIPMGHFLLVVHWNQVCISSSFRDTAP